MGRPRQYDSRVMKPVRTEFEGIQFDSQWEVTVYHNLRMFFPRESIQCHLPLEVLPKSEFFPALNWRVDFTILDNSLRSPLYVEAKGIVNQEIKLVLQGLAFTQPDLFKRLIVVAPQSGIKLGSKLVTCNLHVMSAYLSHLKN